MQEALHCFGQGQLYDFWIEAKLQSPHFFQSLGDNSLQLRDGIGYHIRIHRVLFAHDGKMQGNQGEILRDLIMKHQRSRPFFLFVSH